jgi:hypothetical protein
METDARNVWNWKPANATLYNNFHDTTSMEIDDIASDVDDLACCFSLMSMTLLLIPLLLRLLCFDDILFLLLVVGNLLFLCPELVQNALSWARFFLLPHLTPGVSVFCHGWRRLAL